MPHRAIYELSLDRRGTASGIAALTGRLAIEMTGSACEGYAVNFRLVTRFSDSEGTSTTSDLRSSTFEGGEGETFRFLTQNYVNQMQTEATDGIASREGDATEVRLTKPAEDELTLAGDILFPSEHLKAIIAAAQGGETMLQATIYDGSESGVKTYETTAVIGKPITDEQPAEAVDGAEILSDLQSWPVTISYYEEQGPGEQLPVYEISFDLYENGVSTDLYLDYGDFSLSGELDRFDALTAAPCN